VETAGSTAGICNKGELTMQQIRNMTQQERYEQAKAKLKTFEAKHGNKLMFPSNQREHRLAARRYDLQDAVADAYWTDEMEKAIRLARAKGRLVTAVI
jgi:hypothetical protein